MKSYIVYHNGTGEILRTGVCPDDRVSGQIVESYEVVIEGIARDLIHYVNTSTQAIMDKTTLPCSINKTTMDADSVDPIIISNLPNPSVIKIKGERSWEVTDDTFEFTTDTPGKYEITASSSIYLPVGYTINAN